MELINTSLIAKMRSGIISKEDPMSEKDIMPKKHIMPEKDIMSKRQQRGQFWQNVFKDAKYLEDLENLVDLEVLRYWEQFDPSAETDLGVNLSKSYGKVLVKSGPSSMIRAGS